MPSPRPEPRVPDDAPASPVSADGAPAELAALPALASEVLAGSLNLERTIERLLGLLVPTHASWAQVTVEGVLGRQEVVARSSDGVVEHLEEPAPAGDAHASVSGVVLTGRRAQLPKVGEAELAGLVPGDRASACAHLLGRPGIVLPLQGRGAIFGTLTLLGAEGLEDEPVLRVLDELAQRASLFVDAARLYSERSRIAEYLQRGLRPPILPAVPGVRIATFYRPADDAAGVGGDFYDLHGAGGDWTLVLGDVAGKGVEAAVLAGAVRRSVRTAALVDRSPARVLGLLNAVLLEDETERFVTLLCGRLRAVEEPAWRLELASAGHPPPIIARRDGEVASVGVRGTVAGAVADPPWEEVAVTLQPGDSCLLFTDGVTESRDVDGELFGRERIAALFAEVADAEPEAIVEHIARSAIEYGKRARDDIALLALKVDA